MKPIKIKKKKRKRCPNCRHYVLWTCGLTDERLPAKVMAVGCPSFKYNKLIYF